jgi:dTDP-4-amino-4,6-dideoxygalactose transaminase
VFDGMREAGIGVQVHYVPVHHHPVSQDIGLQPGDLPICDNVYDQILSLPIYPTLKDAEQDYVVKTLTELL